jgi:hypothetical protein
MTEKPADTQQEITISEAATAAVAPPGTAPSTGWQSRRTPWAATWSALRQMRTSFATAGGRVRREDKLTSIWLVVSVIIGTAVFIFPQQAQSCEILFDVVFGYTIISYAMQRLGIFATLNERQTLLVSELLIATLMLGIFIAFNIDIVFSGLRNMLLHSLVK